eukprot:5090064-Ditylum_brightwellii.AAC.1
MPFMLDQDFHLSSDNPAKIAKHCKIPLSHSSNVSTGSRNVIGSGTSDCMCFTWYLVDGTLSGSDNNASTVTVVNYVSTTLVVSTTSHLFGT